jgi:ABC-type oligopeptide transport system, periplasmic component
LSKKRVLKVLAVMLSLLMLSTALAGCSGTKTPSDQGGKKSIVFNLGTDPGSIDPAINDAIDGNDVITANFEGLTRIDENNNVVAGVASDWKVSDDKLTYTFNLRKDAKWSDGQPVKATDFEYAWKRALDKNLAAAYAMFLTDYVKNAAEYYAGKAKWEDVGIKVKSDSQIEVTLKNPTPYFLQLVAQAVYMPLRKDAVEKDAKNWTQDGSTYLGNGPFQMVKWTHNDSITWKKNTNYWNAKNVYLDSMTFVMVNDQTSALTAWDGNEIDIIENPPSSEIPKLIADKKLALYPYLSTIFVYFNTSKKELSDVRVRKALMLSIDREAIVKNVTKAGEKPAYSFVALGMKEPDGKTEFKDKSGDLFKKDVAQAKQLLADAGYPDGKGFPEVVYLYNTSDLNKGIAETLQEQWRTNLGVNIKIENIEWKVFLDRRRKQHDYMAARGSWVGDYSDPMTFLDMFRTTSPFNDTVYKNPEYDKLIEQATVETDVNKRSTILHQAEKMLIDDAVVCPIFFPYSKELIKPNIKGYYVVSTGTSYFDKIKVEAAK